MAYEVLARGEMAKKEWYTYGVSVTKKSSFLGL